MLSRMFHSKKDDEEIESISKLISNNEKTLSDYDKKMIRNIVDLKDINVKEIMIPRVDVTFIDKDSDLSEIIKIVLNSGFSRFPVFSENEDNIVGILHSKDILTFFEKRDKFELNKIIRLANFVPDTKYISELLIEMREKKAHMHVVVNEYGGVCGIVCLEDIIEEIVGDIQDEFDNEDEDIVKIDDNKYLINSRVLLEDLNEVLDINIKDEEVDTLGGFIFRIFGKIPVKNEKIEYENLKFTINTVYGRRIKSILVEKIDRE